MYAENVFRDFYSNAETVFMLVVESRNCVSVMVPSMQLDLTTSPYESMLRPILRAHWIPRLLE